MTVDELLKTVSRDIIFYDESGGGVTFSGGEPLMQAKFLEPMLYACKAAGIRTAVDTSGFAPWDTLARISSKADLILYDLKVVDSNKHQQVTGVKNDLILQNLSALAREHVPVIVRIPVVPTVNDDEANIEASIRFLAGAGLMQLDLLAYHRIGIEKYQRLQVKNGFREFPVPSAEQMESIAERFSKAGFSVRIGG
jgi:pyruvate formate lyase activating enzyme